MQLMQCESINVFEELESEVNSNWSHELIEYFDTRLRRDIIEYAARLVLEELNPYNGVTNNM